MEFKEDVDSLKTLIKFTPPQYTPERNRFSERMVLNGNDAYHSVNDGTPLCVVFSGTQCSISTFLNKANTKLLEGDIDWYVDVFQVCINDVLPQLKNVAHFKHSAKFPRPEVMVEMQEQS